MQTTAFNVAGMTCGSCVTRVTNALRSVDGVGSVNVSLAGAAATVEFDHQLTTPEQLQAAVRQAGYDTNAVQAATPKPRGGCCCH
ncbi:MAG TPA: copper chaperone [Oxalobacteraceae bacterium]|nr:copper chaperone [Oxalobacteraceae bacterium]